MKYKRKAFAVLLFPAYYFAIQYYELTCRLFVYRIY